jgi:predicted CXXCH cytochrome family protein
MDNEIAEYSHGYDSTKLPSPNDVVDSSLPYGNNTIFQCTTCHNVHDGTNEPFLQDDIDVLCARCHTDRQFVGGVDKPAQDDWGEYYGFQNPGSHPIGTDVFEDRDGNSPIDIIQAGVFNIAYGPSAGHNLGGHLIDGATGPGTGAGITCVTCHVVHGSQLDTNPPVGGIPATPDLLVIPQPTEGGAYNGAVYNGNGDPSNALCEACHISEAQTIDAATGLAYSGAYHVNPGATEYTHPVDDLGASDLYEATASPADWPVGSLLGAGASYGVICESCHTPHPAANIDRETILAPSNTHILRASEDPTDPQYICNQCHDFSAGGICSHPTNVPMGRMYDPDIGNNDSILTCNDCHFTGAHNRTGLDIGLDPDWEPPGNARGAEADERTSVNTSKECEDCHYADNANLSPTNNAVDRGSPVSHDWRTSESYQDIGEGTHYLGPASLDYSGGLFDGAPFDATTDYWTGQGQPNPRWSRFDGASGHVVCESCHELEADKNVPGTAALLAQYNDGGTGEYDDPSGLCEGCHGHSPGGGGTSHPMTGDLVTRTGKELATDSSHTRRDIQGNVTYPADNGLNCDTCHQPHDADTDGGTYIFDSDPHSDPQYDVTSEGQLGDDHVPTNLRGGDVIGKKHSQFCTSCHSYLD